MSNPLGIDDSLKLIERLKLVLQDFANRETQLTTQYRSRVSAEQNARDKALSQLQAELDESLNVATSANLTRKADIEAAFKRRKSKLAQAHRNSNRRALQRIEDREGRRKHKLQMDTMQATKNRENGLKATESSYAEFLQNLDQEHTTFLSVEEKAKAAFSGYGSFRKMLETKFQLGVDGQNADRAHLLSQFKESIQRAESDLKRFRRKLLPHIFKLRFIWLILALLQFVAVPLLQRFGITSFTYIHAGASFTAIVVLGIILHQFSKARTKSLATNIANAVTKGRVLDEFCYAKNEAFRTDEIARIEKEFQDRTAYINEQWQLTIDEAASDRECWPRRIDDKAKRANSTNERLLSERIAQADRRHRQHGDELNQEFKTRQQQVIDKFESRLKDFAEEHRRSWEELEAEWKSKVPSIYEEISEAQRVNGGFPEWIRDNWKSWKMPKQFNQVARFGSLQVDTEKLAGLLPKDPRLAIPAKEFGLPLLLNYPHQGSFLIETRESGRDEAIATLNNLVLRLLTSAPAGRLAFSVIDPVGLGQNFAGVMHLADQAEHLINSRIWTQSSQIEERLGELNEHMEKVIQMYLRNEYATIAEYNEQAGNIAEKYHFLVVADFPVNFTDAAARRLLSIANSGARCGVYTLIHWNQTQPAPQDFIPEELRRSSITVANRGQHFSLAGKMIAGTSLKLDAPPAADLATELIQKIGESSRDSNRVEVPFAHVAPSDSEIWTSNTTTELRVPIGRTGATKLQYLEIGKGTRQHALVAGKTGSGKSTLFHVVITNLALWCSPEQVEFYLIDFKKGVEFKCYATHRLPHARVVAIESDREFGLSVLQRVDEELRRRGEIFRKVGAQDLAGYKRSGATEPMPRSLLIIDEFQEFFVEDDKIAQAASVLLDRIVRQGRAFGIHVFLGSQTLGGAYTMARTTLGQMVIRIALQCNEADAYLIMDDSNPAPRLLSRPGEGIYNDEAGALQGNSPFQTVWLPDEVRDLELAKVQEHSKHSGHSYPSPVVFEGNAPADIRENEQLTRLLLTKASTLSKAPRIWFGAPNAIKGPTETAFHRQSGNNLLVVGQRDDAISTFFAAAIISIAAQIPKGQVRFVLFEGNAPETSQRASLDRVAAALSNEVTVVKPTEINTVMSELATELNRRSEANQVDAPAIFIIVHDIHKLNKLRYEDDFSFSSDDEAKPASQLNKIISEGPGVGIHVLVSCDTYNNVSRYLSKKALSEFEMRILFQMSANDSASLIDSPKAGNLGLHRALFYNEQEAHLETFRPYASPDEKWFDDALRQVSARS